MRRIEWPTMAMIFLCYVSWAVSVFVLVQASVTLAILVTGLSVALHSSIQHEIIHGHPTRSKWFNECLVFPALGLFVPFGRFRDTHIQHHLDARLTDPYDDPESNFLDLSSWNLLSAPVRVIYRFNNTLLGRVLIGVIISQIWFTHQEWQRVRGGQHQVINSWVAHLISASIVLSIIWVSPMSFWQYLGAVYLGNALIKIRTFAEHQAHEVSEERSVVIADRGLLSILFLNNNFHAVHHAKPGVPWYEIPRLFKRNKTEFCDPENGYYFANYATLFREFFFRQKDPVAHPLWRRD